MYCTNCGMQNSDTARFCRSCGAPQSSGAVRVEDRTGTSERTDNGSPVDLHRGQWVMAAPEPVPSPISIGPRQIVAFVGSAVLLLGVFCPAVDTGYRSWNIWWLGLRDGKAVIVLALLASALVLFRRYASALWGIGAVALLVTVWDAIAVGSRYGWSTLRWGWIVPILGALIVLVAPFLPDRAPQGRRRIQGM